MRIRICLQAVIGGLGQKQKLLRYKDNKHIRGLGMHYGVFFGSAAVGDSCSAATFLHLTVSFSFLFALQSFSAAVHELRLRPFLSSSFFIHIITCISRFDSSTIDFEPYIRIGVSSSPDTFFVGS
jgi:hypothetical protein